MDFGGQRYPGNSKGFPPVNKIGFCAGIWKTFRFSRLLHVRKIGLLPAAVAVGMWKPAFCAGFQAPGGLR
jgi:hypothetical protein